MSDTEPMPDTTEEPAQPPKPNPREPHAVCGQCWCIVADLTLHVAAAHSTAEEATTDGS